MRGPTLRSKLFQPPCKTRFMAIDQLLEPMGARLMPTAMHPWMDPRTETRLWPHDNALIYQAYDRIFDCKKHGQANLQSMHINLPFADDAEFARLHAAIRLVLPIIPALAASSPIADGKASGYLDYRMEAYRTAVQRVPSAIGQVIPDTVNSRAEYRGADTRTLVPRDRGTRSGWRDAARVAQCPRRDSALRAQCHRDPRDRHTGVPAGRPCHCRRHQRRGAGAL